MDVSFSLLWISTLSGRLFSIAPLNFTAIAIVLYAWFVSRFLWLSSVE